MSPPQAVLVVNEALRIRFANESVAGLCGQTVGELIGCSLLDRFPADDDVGSAELRASFDIGESTYFSSTIETDAGHRLRVSFRFNPVPFGAQKSGARAVLVVVATEALHVIGEAGEGDGEQRFRATYEHTSLSYADAVELYSRLEEIMLAQQLYLDKTLDLETVCRQLQTNQLYLSQVVNFFAGENFRDYLNRKRIAYLEEFGAEATGMGIGDLWRLAGFGSYSAFRRFLQADRDLTPGAFARQLRRPAKIEV